MAFRSLGRRDLWMKMGENLVTSVAKLQGIGFTWKTSTSEALQKLGARYAVGGAAKPGEHFGLGPHDSPGEHKVCAHPTTWPRQ